MKKITTMIFAMFLCLIGCGHEVSDLQRFGELLNDENNTNSAIVKTYLPSSESTLNIELNAIEDPDEEYKTTAPKIYEAYLQEAEARRTFKSALDTWFKEVSAQKIEEPSTYDAIFTLKSQNDDNLSVFALYEGSDVVIDIDDNRTFYRLDDDMAENLEDIYNTYIAEAEEAFGDYESLYQ